MEKAKKRATKAQRTRIEGMLMSGLIDRTEAQGIISKARAASELAHAERWFPGRGEAVSRLYEPMADWKPVPNAALPDLEERAKAAIFWREIKGVRQIPASNMGLYWSAIGEDLWKGLRASYSGSQTNTHDDLHRSFILAWVENEPKEVFLGALPAQHEFYGDALRRALAGLLWDSFWWSLYYPCCCIAENKHKDAAKYQPLLDLWFAGNFPVGFDKEGNLLVLVAD